MGFRVEERIKKNDIYRHLYICIYTSIKYFVYRIDNKGNWINGILISLYIYLFVLLDCDRGKAFFLRKRGDSA